MRIPVALYASFPMAIILVAVWATIYFATSSGSRAATPVSPVSVIDGDTVQIGKEIIQLYGIDALELGQRCHHDGVWTLCGLSAAFELRKIILVANGDVQCVPTGSRRRKAVQVCLAGGIDVALVLLAGGYVVADSDTTEGYREAQNAARQGRLGLWHSQFVFPVQWRAGRRLPGEARAETVDCPIKAVISADGKRLYYVPTDDAYRSITVDRSKGERSYCSDEQARQAGWRREGEPPDDGAARR